MTYGGGKIFKVTSTGIAGLKVAICSKLRRLTRNGGAGACCRVASVASSLVCYNLRRLVLGCAKPSFLIILNKIQTPAPKNPEV